MPVDVEVSDVAMQALSHEVCHVPERQNVVAAEHRDAVFKAQALARLHFFVNGFQAAVFNRRVALLISMCDEARMSAAQNAKKSRLT